MPSSCDVTACGANAAHGLRRTNADKRMAVTKLLDDEEWKSKPALAAAAGTLPEPIPRRVVHVETKPDRN